MFRKVALTLLLCLVVLLGLTGTASAHAILVGTTPDNWEVLEASPKEMTLRFNEPIDAALADIRLLGPRGDDISGIGRPQHPGGDAKALSVAIPDTLANGTHTVAYRVVSADSHPVQGAFTFSVGQATGGAAAAALPGSGGDSLSFVYGLLRWLAYAALALLIGTAYFATRCWPGGTTRTGLRRVWWAACAVLACCTAGMLLVYSPYATGRPLSSAFSLLGTTFGSRLGIMLLARLGLLAVAVAGMRFLRLDGSGERGGASPAPKAVPAAVREPALAGVPAGRHSSRPAPSRPSAEPEGTHTGKAGNGLPAVVVLAFGVALCLTWSLADHAATGVLVPLALVADVAHLMAMSIWLGGLAVLAGVMLRSGDVLGMRLAVPRFSRTALICVCVLVATGIFQAWRQIGTPRELAGTTYGALLLGKAGVVALVTGLGWLSRRWVVRHYGFPVVTVTDKRRARRGPPPGEIRRFRRTVAVETALAVVVLGVTAVLVSVEPANAQIARESAAAQVPAYTGPVNVVLPFDAGGPNGSGKLAVTVLPGKVGPNEIHLSVVDAQYQPRDVPEVRAELRLRAKNLGPLPVDLQYIGAGHYIAQSAVLPMPGQWELAITVRTSDTDQAVVRIPVGAR